MPYGMNDDPSVIAPQYVEPDVISVAQENATYSDRGGHAVLRLNPKLAASFYWYIFALQDSAATENRWTLF